MICDTAVILAGGKGTRLMPLTRDIPKPMVPIHGKPFLYWQIMDLRDQGITEIILLVSHLAAVIQDYFREQPINGIRISYAMEPSPLGTGGALRNAQDRLPTRFWLLNGDSFLHTNLDQFERYHATGGWDATIAAVHASEVPVPGNLQFSHKQIESYCKGAGVENGFPYVDAGIYLIEKRVVTDGPIGNFDLGNYWPPLIAAKRLGAYLVEERFYDIGTTERLRTFERYVEQHLPI